MNTHIIITVSQPLPHHEFPIGFMLTTTLCHATADDESQWLARMNRVLVDQLPAVLKPLYQLHMYHDDTYGVDATNLPYTTRLVSISSLADLLDHVTSFSQWNVKSLQP